jgi:hypothetical protein
MARLRSGELVATGLKVPISENSEPVMIAPRLWSVLVPNFKRSSAKGPGIEFVNVRICRARKPIGAGPAQALATEEQVRKLVRTRTARRRGPASLMDEIKAEMKARAQSGKLRKKFSEESAYLEQWAKHEFPDFPRKPTAKSIREALREDYNTLKAD